MEGIESIEIRCVATEQYNELNYENNKRRGNQIKEHKRVRHN